MKKLFEAIEKLNIYPGGLTGDAAAKIEHKAEEYMSGILRWNEKVNLTAITDRDDFIRKHFIDSILCASAEEFASAEKVADIGTGGGFPGVPLAILFPEKRFVLIDSLAKRLKIVDDVCRSAGIENVTTVHGRAEDLAGRNGEYRERFDCVVSRAVAGMASLAELCIPFVRIGGVFIAYKGREYEDELKDGAEAIKTMGGKIKRTEISSDLNESLEHALIYIEKEKETPVRYPRKAGDPARRPIR